MGERGMIMENYELLQIAQLVMLTAIYVTMWVKR